LDSGHHDRRLWFYRHCREHHHHDPVHALPWHDAGENATPGWLNLIMCGMVLIAVSPLTAAQIMLLLDRFAGSHFFDTQAGGSATLWMHFSGFSVILKSMS